jgi:hypothetical protein
LWQNWRPKENKVMKGFARIVLGIGSPVLLLAFLVGGEIGTWAFVVVGPLFPVALIALGAGGNGRSRSLAVLLLLFALSLEAGSIGILALHRWPRGDLSIFGLPPGTILMLVALGLVPFLLITLGYTALFRKDDGLDPDGR